jgi:hypothetical protein
MFKVSGMSSPVILDKIGFYSPLCALNISCTKKMIKIQQNKTLDCVKCLVLFVSV